MGLPVIISAFWNGAVSPFAERRRTDRQRIEISNSDKREVVFIRNFSVN